MKRGKLIAGMLAFGAFGGYLTAGSREYKACRKNYLNENMNKNEFKGCEFYTRCDPEPGHFWCENKDLEPILSKQADKAGELCKKDANILLNMVGFSAIYFSMVFLIAGDFPTDAELFENNHLRP